MRVAMLIRSILTGVGLLCLISLSVAGCRTTAPQERTPAASEAGRRPPSCPVKAGASDPESSATTAESDATPPEQPTQPTQQNSPENRASVQAGDDDPGLCNLVNPTAAELEYAADNSILYHTIAISGSDCTHTAVTGTLLALIRGASRLQVLRIRRVLGDPSDILQACAGCEQLRVLELESSLFDGRSKDVDYKALRWLGGIRVIALRYFGSGMAQPGWRALIENAPALESLELMYTYPWGDCTATPALGAQLKELKFPLCEDAIVRELADRCVNLSRVRCAIQNCSQLTMNTLLSLPQLEYLDLELVKWAEPLLVDLSLCASRCESVSVRADAMAPTVEMALPSGRVWKRLGMSSSMRVRSNAGEVCCEEIAFVLTTHVVGGDLYNALEKLAKQVTWQSMVLSNRGPGLALDVRRFVDTIRDFHVAECYLADCWIVGGDAPVPEDFPKIAVRRMECVKGGFTTTAMNWFLACVSVERLACRGTYANAEVLFRLAKKPTLRECQICVDDETDPKDISAMAEGAGGLEALHIAYAWSKVYVRADVFDGVTSLGSVRSLSISGGTLSCAGARAIARSAVRVLALSGCRIEAGALCELMSSSALTVLDIYSGRAEGGIAGLSVSRNLTLFHTEWVHGISREDMRELAARSKRESLAVE